jgi:hypothetical protein
MRLNPVEYWECIVEIAYGKPGVEMAKEIADMGYDYMEVMEFLAFHTKIGLNKTKMLYESAKKLNIPVENIIHILEKQNKGELVNG